MRQRWLWAGAGSLTVCAGLALAVATVVKVPERTFVVQPADVQAGVTVTGVLTPRTQWQLSFGQTLEQQDGHEATVGVSSCPPAGADAAGQSLGPVKAVLAQSGQPVAAGEVLAEADTTAVKAALALAGQDLADAQSLYKEHKDLADAASPATPAGSTSVSASAAGVAVAAASAAGQLKAAALGQLGPDLDRIQRDRQQTAALQALVSAAELTAPADAVVQDVYATPGITPTCGTTMVVLRTAALTARLHLDPDQLKQLQPGQPVHLTVPGTAVAADLTLPHATDPAPDAQPTAQPSSAAGTALSGYTLDLPWPDQSAGGTVMPGSPVTSTFTVQHEQVLAVPPTAIHLRQNRPYVTVHRCSDSSQDCTAVETAVTEGLASADRVEITDGLHGGDVVLLPN